MIGMKRESMPTSMSINFKFSHGLLAGMLLLSATQPRAAQPLTEAPPSDEAIRKLLPRVGFEPLDPSEHKKFEQLVALGEKAYPVLADQLLKTENYYEMRILKEIFLQSHGNKTIPRQAFATLLARHQGASIEDMDIQLLAKDALKKIGAENSQPTPSSQAELPDSRPVKPTAPAPSTTIAPSSASPTPISTRWPWLLATLAVLLLAGAAALKLRRR